MQKFRFLLITTGKFHYLELAKALSKKKQLFKIVLGYPWFKIKRYNIPKTLVDFFGLYTIFDMLLYNFSNNFIQKFRLIIQRLNFEKISSKIEKYKNKSDVILFLSGSVGKKIFKVKENKNILICERASAHILFQKKILEEEYDLFNLQQTKKSLLKYGFAKWKIENEILEYNYADYILSPSKFVSNSFENYNLKKIIEIPYAADTSMFYKDNLISREKDKFNILFVGQLSLRKGLYYLIEAMKNFKHPGASLHIIGAGNSEETIFFKNNSKSIKNIYFHGIIKNDKLRYFYNKADIMVLPSIEDGFGIVALEALACGCPILVSENTGAKDTVLKYNCGQIFPIRDSKEILNKIENLANNKKLLEYFSTNATKATNIQNWDNYASILNKKIDNIKNENDNKFYIN